MVKARECDEVSDRFFEEFVNESGSYSAGSFVVISAPEGAEYAVDKICLEFS